MRFGNFSIFVGFSSFGWVGFVFFFFLSRGWGRIANAPVGALFDFFSNLATAFDALLLVSLEILRMCMFRCFFF